MLYRVGIFTFYVSSFYTFFQSTYLMAGLLHVNRNGEIEGGNGRVGCYEEVLNMEGMSRQELLQLDREGRCLVTDHGSFGKFNFTSCHHSWCLLL